MIIQIMEMMLIVIINCDDDVFLHDDAANLDIKIVMYLLQFGMSIDNDALIKVNR